LAGKTRLIICYGLRPVLLCTAYRRRGEMLDLPPAGAHALAECEPVFEELPGWKTSAAGLTDISSEEERLNLTASQTTGRLNLGLTVGVTDGVDTANLLTGKWQF